MRTLGILLTASLLLAGCATVPMAGTGADAEGKRFDPPPPGRSALYVYRSSMLGTESIFNIADNQQPVGALADKTWIRVDVAPGPHVANTIRLLDLPPAVQEMVRDGQITAGLGRALIGVPDPLAMARQAVAEKLTVRDLERLAGDTKRKAKGGDGHAKGKPGPPGGSPKTADTRALEKRLEEALGLKVDLALRGLGEQSVLTLEIRDFDQLDTVVDKLTRR